MDRQSGSLDRGREAFGKVAVASVEGQGADWGDGDYAVLRNDGWNGMHAEALMDYIVHGDAVYRGVTPVLVMEGINGASPRKKRWKTSTNTTTAATKPRIPGTILRAAVDDSEAQEPTPRCIVKDPPSPPDNHTGSTNKSWSDRHSHEITDEGHNFDTGGKTTLTLASNAKDFDDFALIVLVRIHHRGAGEQQHLPRARDRRISAAQRVSIRETRCCWRVRGYWRLA